MNTYILEVSDKGRIFQVEVKAESAGKALSDFAKANWAAATGYFATSATEKEQS